MRQTIELLRKQSINVGLTSAHMQSMGVQVNGHGIKSPNSPNKSLTQNTSQLQSTNQPNELKNGSSQMSRHHSTDSMCSINSMSSGCSQDKKKKKGWVSSLEIFLIKTFF